MLNDVCFSLPLSQIHSLHTQWGHPCAKICLLLSSNSQTQMLCAKWEIGKSSLDASVILWQTRCRIWCQLKLTWWTKGFILTWSLDPIHHPVTQTLVWAKGERVCYSSACLGSSTGLFLFKLYVKICLNSPWAILFSLLSHTHITQSFCCCPDWRHFINKAWVLTWDGKLWYVQSNIQWSNSCI